MSTPTLEHVRETESAPGRPKKGVYDVQVVGLPLKLRSSHEPEFVDELVQIVDHKVKEAMQANAAISFQNALVLATLNMAEELVLLKQTLFGELDRVETHARTILDRFDDIMATPEVEA